MTTSSGVSAPNRADSEAGVPRRPWAGFWASVATIVGVVTLGESYAVGGGGELGPFGVYDPPVWALPAVLAAGALGATGSWVTVGRRPAASSGLALATAVVLLPFWASWDWLPGPVRSGVLAMPPLAVAGVARAVAGLAPRRPTALVRRGLLAVWLLAGAAVLVRLAGYNPFADPGCARVCADVEPPLGGILAPYTAVLAACVLTSCAAGTALVPVGGAALAEVPRAALGAALVALGMLAAASAWETVRWGEPAPSVTQQLLEPLAVALVAATVCAAAVRAALTRAAFDRLAHHLSGPDAGLTGVAAGVRGAHFAMPAAPGTPGGEVRWIDVSGREVAATAPGRCVVLGDDEGQPVLRLLLDRHTDGDDVLAGLSPTTRLALGNARLSAVLRARLTEIRASQRRVVAASDAERRRLERDLHDGVQQRLVSAALHLKVAASVMPSARALALSDAEAAVRGALSELRRIAHGFFPGVLADEGLDAGLEDLAAACAIPVSVDSGTDVAGGTDAALAGYAVAAAALDAAAREPRAARAEVLAESDGDTCTVRVVITAQDTAAQHGTDDAGLSDAADRVGAAGGEFTLSSTTEDGVVVTVVTAVIPCGS
ncbi:sensor histidine kinase [Streptomyces sp. NPDC059690]|uniref:sensor histidine kinase n=1 Tax=Streptomyces sp. NPDC059690 TaxID=3346907 RepID=UPI003685717F